jgi:hypothetical protein
MTTHLQLSHAGPNRIHKTSGRCVEKKKRKPSQPPSTQSKTDPFPITGRKTHPNQNPHEKEITRKDNPLIDGTHDNSQ